ncbi:hypothetical protein BDW02DRAFT_490455 [Decorospora gaudefroyi]|uniref:RNase MRP protein 1 RNA binding domain-containing protein n=1 Tax=Decorospora gaudefroyi TaxID=184978 RepID=A0A6A5KQA3_9PLEO|nr:hypothetical protein BDW02DRAFT_490455 [Decorospora gaudefroyi]
MPASTSTSATPTITANALLSASAHDIAMLHDIHALLNKIFIRNRNQHHRSHWWKRLHSFRKQLALLLQEHADSNATKMEARLRFWDEGTVHAWYYQFSQLIAVGPFAMLGLVMMASVARVCRIVGITGVYEEIASADIRGVLGANDELGLAVEFASVLDAGEEWDGDGDVDVGVVVAREEEKE